MENSHSNRQSYQQEEKKIRSGYRGKMLFLLIGLGTAVLFSFWVGYYPLSPGQVVSAFLSGLGIQTEVIPQAVTIFWRIRLPRVLAALMIGASLSVSGAVYQGMFRNPLVSPDILGVSAGASMGAAFSIFFGFPYWYTQIFAFACGGLTVFLCYLISTKSVHSQTLSLVLTGSMLGTLCNAVVTMIKYLSDPNDVLQQLTFWLMGSLNKVSMDSLLLSLFPMLAGLVIIYCMRWRINLLALDDEEAQSLGMNTRKYRILLIAASTLLSASAVCLGGLIGWVGLMIPHLARALFGPDYERLVPGCMLMGGLYLLLMDDLARSLLSLELPIGVVTAFMGVPFFVGLILRRKA